MANIQHAVIPDAFLHEPKGVVAAGSGSVYVANGSGSGVWKKTDSLSIKGMVGDGGSTNLKPVSDGTNGFNLRADAAYGSMTLTNNTNAFVVSAAADGTLNTNSDYALFTGTGAPLISGANMLGVTFSVNQLTIGVKGIYKVSFWANVFGWPSTVAVVAVKTLINGSTYATRKIMAKSDVVGDIGVMSTNEFVSFNANDTIQLAVASNIGGGITLSDGVLSVELIQAT